MVNARVLLVDPDSGYLNFLSSALKTQNHEFDIKCCTSQANALSMLSGNDYDVLVCEASLYADRMNARKGVIIMSDEYDVNLNYKYGVNYSLRKPIDPNMLLNRIISVILGQKEYRSLDERISMILLTCGISPHIRGSKYLRDAIKFVCGKPSVHDLKVTKDVYPAIAKMNDTEPSRIERGIRHAIESAWERGKLTGVRNVIGLELYDKSYKPTNFEFIKLIADKLIMEMDRVGNF